MLACKHFNQTSSDGWIHSGRFKALLPLFAGDKNPFQIRLSDRFSQDPCRFIAGKFIACHIPDSSANRRRFKFFSNRGSNIYGRNPYKHFICTIVCCNKTLHLNHRYKAVQIVIETDGTNESDSDISQIVKYAFYSMKTEKDT